MTTLREKLERIATEYETRGEIPADLALQVIEEIKPKDAIQPKTDECQKIVDVQEQSAVLSGFYDWLREERIHLAKYEKVERDEYGDYEEREELFPIRDGPEVLFARYFNIDLNKVEEERRTLLAKIRADQEAD